MADFILPDSLGEVPTQDQAGSGFVLPDSLGSVDTAEANSVGSKLSSIFQALKQAGAGAIDSSAQLSGFLQDQFTLVPNRGNLGTQAAASLKEYLGGAPAKETLAKVAPGESERLREVAAEALPAEDPDYRYARRFGEFLGPTVATGGAAGGTSAALKAALSALTGSAAGQYVEDEGGNQWAQLGASIFGGAAPEAARSILAAGRNAITGPTTAEVLGSAAKVQKDLTGLTAEQIKAAAEKAAKDKLGLAQLRTTAEITDNAGMGQLEKTLASRPEFANQYAGSQQLRSDTRDALLAGMTKSKGTTKAALGEELIKATGSNKSRLKGIASEKWEALPEAVGSLETAQKGLLDDLANLKGRSIQSGVGADTKKLIKDVLEPVEGANTTQGMQQLRSDALGVLRDFKASGASSYDKVILGNLEKNLKNSIDEAYGATDAALYGEARAATATEKSIFGKKTTGGKLLKEELDPAKALKQFTGTKQSAEQLKIAANLEKNPGLKDKINRSLLDEMRGKKNKPLTPARVEDFLAKNEEGLNVLLGKPHVKKIKNIAEDLQSQYGLPGKVFGASTGGPPTAQRTTVAGAIADAIGGSTIPNSGVISKSVNTIRKTLGIDAEAKVSEYLFQAAMNPKFAEQLAMTPTTTRVMNWLERLKEGIMGVGKAGAIAGGLETLRPVDAPKEAPRAPAAVVAPALAPTAQPKADAAIEPTAAVDTGFKAALKAIEYVESRGNKNAVSPKGAIGTHQVMPIAMRDVMRAKGINDKIYSDAQLRQMAAEDGASEYYGTEYVKLLYDRFDGNWPLVFAAYNSGPSLVKKLLKDSNGSSFEDIARRLPTETRNYVPAVQAALSRITKA